VARTAGSLRARRPRHPPRTAAVSRRASPSRCRPDRTIRLTDVALGELFAADSIEASVALDSLLEGNVSADEIRVAGRHHALTVERDGDSDLARLVRRLAHVGPHRPGRHASRIRRIVVSSGTLDRPIAGSASSPPMTWSWWPDAGGRARPHRQAPRARGRRTGQRPRSCSRRSAGRGVAART